MGGGWCDVSSEEEGQYSGQVWPYCRCGQQQLTTGKHRSWWALPAVPQPSPAQSVALGTWKKPFCFSRNSSCSPWKVLSIWQLAAVTCYAAHLPCRWVDKVNPKCLSPQKSRAPSAVYANSITLWQGCSFHLPPAAAWDTSLARKHQC